jgi:hypothetical protein
MPNSFKLKLLSATLTLGSLPFPALGTPQSPPPGRVPMWKEARRPAAKGTSIPVPQVILNELKADLDECADPSPSETTKMEAYRVRNGGSFLIAIRGRSSCFCGATGNCTLWVYRLRRGKYEKILDTDMVNYFGFLTSRTNGHPDLVLWSHDSAQWSPAQLLRFDGEAYWGVCGWEEEYEYRKRPDGIWVPLGDPKIVSNNCDLKPTPKQGQR